MYSIIGCTSSQEPACQCRRYKRPRFNPWVGKIPWRRNWQSTPVLPGKAHGQRSQVGYISWGCRIPHDWSNLVDILQRHHYHKSRYQPSPYNWLPSSICLPLGENLLKWKGNWLVVTLYQFWGLKYLSYAYYFQMYRQEVTQIKLNSYPAKYAKLSFACMTGFVWSRNLQVWSLFHLTLWSTSWPCPQVELVLLSVCTHTFTGFYPNVCMVVLHLQIFTVPPPCPS